MPVQTRSATENLRNRSRMHIQETLLTESVLNGRNDAIIAVPLGDESLRTDEKLCFQALYLAGKSMVLPPVRLNNPHSQMLDSFYNGALQIDVLRYFQNDADKQHYALICVHANEPLVEQLYSANESAQHTFATFAFQYWT